MPYRPADAALLLADFGVACTAGAVSFTGLLDAPDALIAGEPGVQSREYELTFVTAEVALTLGAAVTVDGVAYRVRVPPQQVDDGLLSRVLLTRA